MKKLFTLLIAVLIFSTQIWAQTPVAPSLGDGSTGNPYQIANINNLAWLQDGTNYSQWGMNFIQTADIDASVTASWNYDGYSTTLGFSPIGNDYSNYPFSGTYNGQGHTITGLTINRQYYYYVGLFGYTLASCSISNLGLINVNITGTEFVGGFVGVFQGTISNCYITGTVNGLPDSDGSFEVGGLAGFSSGQISDSYSTATINARAGVGGLVGDVEGGFINNSYSTGSVNGIGDVGGLIGYLASGNISNCYSTSNISSSGWNSGGLIGDLRPGTDGVTINVTNCYSTGNVGGSYSGGLIGTIELLYGTPSISVNMCYATGSVSGNNYFNGGLIGEIATDCTINNCFSRGDATVDNYAGGMIGYLYHPCTLNNCYSTGKPSVTTAYTGGMIAAAYLTSSINNCYWDMTTSLQPTSPGGGIGKTTTQMKDQTNFLYSGFTSIWGINAAKNNGYPYLRGQYVSPLATAATSLTSSGFTANWGAVDEATSYSVIVTDNSCNPIAGSPFIVSAPATNLVITGLSASTVYKYKVKGVNTFGSSVYSNVINVTTNAPVVIAPAAPVATAATSVTASGFVANWGAVATATSYSLEVTDNLGAPIAYSPFTIADPTVSQTITGLMQGATYHYRLTAINIIGPGAYSNVIDVTLPSLTIGTISGSPFQVSSTQNASVQVPFTITGSFSNGNVFTAYLSDASGSFASEVAIGNLTATTSGTINATISVNTPAGSFYRIRVKSTSTVVISNDNGSNLTIQATPDINWTNPADITYNTLLSSTQLNATVTYNGSAVTGMLTYNPVSGSKLNAGSNQDLTITFAPTDATNYAAATKTVKIKITKATPVINWSNPSDIVYGTALCATQLNATASTLGSMVYTPVSGTILYPGTNQTLSVSFAPIDGANYRPATATASINVSKATLNYVADNIAIFFGNPIPTLTYHFNGLVNNDAATVVSGLPALSTAALQTSPIGNYPITIALGNLSASNYNFNFVNGTFTINPATVWNGTSWSNGFPSASLSAQIDAPFTVGVNPPVTNNLTLLALIISPSATLYVKPGCSLTVNGNLYNNGGIVLQGDATSTPTGSFICYGTESGTGTFTAQRNISASGILHYVSSPMPNQTNAVFAPYYSFNTGNGTTWTTYTGILANMTGYAVQYSVNTKMSTFTGTAPFNSGNQQINVNGACAMFLAGNPYPSAIDWVKVAGLAQTNITNTFYIRDVGRNVTCNTTTCAGGVFATDRFIPAMKGFLIKTGTATLGTFKMDNTVLTNATTAYWKDENALSNIVRLKTTGGNYQGDEAVVYFDEFASKGIDNNDGDKLFEEESYYSHLFTLTEDNHPLAINVTPAVKTMPLVFQCGVAGSYSIEASELKLENGNTVFLEDLQNGNNVDLSSGSYNFAYTNTSKPYNFILHFAATSSIKPYLAGSLNVYANKNLIYIQNTFSSNAEVVVYNTLGREVKRLPITGNYSTIEMNVVPGAYMVKVISGSNVVTKKVLIN